MTRAVLRATATLALVTATSLAPVGSIAGAAVVERGPGAGQLPPRSPDAQPSREVAGALRGLQRRCLGAVKQRADLVRTMQKAVDRSVNVTDEHETALDEILANSRTGLTEAATAIVAATTREDLIAACKNVVENLRIMSLVYPQVRITLGGDKTVARSENLTDLLADVPDLLDQIEGLGIDVSEWRTLLDEILAQLDGIGTSVTDAVDGVLALTPEEFGAEATALMDDAVESILGSRSDLEDIDADIEAAFDLIDGLLDGAA